LPFAEVIGGQRLTEPEWAVITVHPFARLQTLTIVTDYKMPNLHIPVYRRIYYTAVLFGGAEIARPDKTAPDQTARLNNGGHEQSSPW